MASIPPHTHDFVIPTPTPQQAIDGSSTQTLSTPSDVKLHVDTRFGNVDNTSDAQKATTGPIADALGGKASTGYVDTAIIGAAKNIAQGRLSLSSLTPVPSVEMTSNTIYYHPVGGNLVPIWDVAGSVFVWRPFGQLLTLPLDSNAAHFGYAASGYNYDLYILWTGSVVRLAHVPSWATGAVSPPNIHKERATGAGSVELEIINGILVNKNTLTARFGTGSGDTIAMPARTGTYIGTFRTTADGVTVDTYRRRLLYNVYNQAPRNLKVAEATSSWAYSTAAYNIMNASLNNQIEVLFGLEGNLVDLTLNFFVSTSHATVRSCLIGLGIDSLVSPVDGAYSYGSANQTISQITARYCDFPGKGQSALSLLTYGAGAGGETQTWWAGSGAEGQVIV